MPTTYAIPNGRTVMDATTITSTGTTQIISNNDLGTTGFKPDLVWSKSGSTTNIHLLFDSQRGVNNYISSDTTSPETNYPNFLTSFNLNGFTLGTAQYSSGVTSVAWQWQAGRGTTSTNTNGSVTSTVSVNATAGFSIATCTTPATNTNFTVGHGLGVAPAFIIVKNRTSTNNWTIYHKSTGAGGGLIFTTAGYFANTDMWANTAPTSTVWSSNTPNWWGTSQNLVAYCWAEIAGFSQFGSYTGNSSNDGPFVYLGFRPKFLMIKRTDSNGYSWWMEDSTRNPTNPNGLDLQAQDPGGTQDDTPTLDFLSNGFKLRNGSYSGFNASGGTYIYAAFAENPFKYANAR